MKTSFTAQEIRAWVPFVQATLHLLAVLDAELKESFDISHLDYGILILLSQEPGRMLRMTDLATTFGVDPSNITYRVRRMEPRGLVERSTGSSDGRVVYARLTDEGLALLRQAHLVHVQGAHRYFLDHIEPEQLEVIAAVFGKLYTLQHTSSNNSAE